MMVDVRLIDANAAIALIKQLRNKEPHNHARIYACNMAMSILGNPEQTPTINPEDCRPEWISVDERLPMTKSEPYYDDGLVQLTESENVLVIAKTPYEDNRMGVVVLVHDLIDDECDWAGSIDDCDASACNITHWMPLPEPPKGD